MKVLVDLSVVPLGVGLSLSRYVAECERVLKEAGLKTALHANGTNIEGDWDEVFAAVRRCHEVLHDMGVPRVSATLRVGTRPENAPICRNQKAPGCRNFNRQGRPRLLPIGTCRATALQPNTS